MRSLEHELTKFSKSWYFATFDLSHVYWQFDLDKDAQLLQSFITPDGIYSLTRVLHGTTNAATHLQSSIADIFPSDLLSFFLYWLDDILLHHSTVTCLLKAIGDLIHLCAERNIKLHPRKCVLFSTQILWCGRLASAAGARYDPKRLGGLLKMEPSTTGAHLQQFICALQWLKNGIRQFPHLLQPLQNVRKAIYDRGVKMKKSSLSRFKISAIGWGGKESEALAACKTALAEQVTLSHRDEQKRLCVYTDESDSVWSGMVTQVPLEDLSILHKEQRHDRLLFLSGRFNSTQMGWCILEKKHSQCWQLSSACIGSLQLRTVLISTPTTTT